MNYFFAALIILMAYLLGSVNGSLLLGRLKNIDIRKLGSGNAGGTNALRTQGIGFALGAVIIDVGKGALAVSVLPLLFLKFHLLGPSPSGLIIYLCGGAAVFGHCYPVWHGFKGGKGAATLIGVLLVITPVVVMYVLLIFVILLIITGFVGPNTVIASLSASVIYAIRHENFLDQTTFWFLVVMGLFIVFTHRENLQRVFQRTEKRFDKVRLLHRLFKKHDG
jgi:glycerol-3-phosphate acyltransferase PlsY